MPHLIFHRDKEMKHILQIFPIYQNLVSILKKTEKGGKIILALWFLNQSYRFCYNE